MMYHTRRRRKKRMSRRSVILLSSLMVLIGLAASATVAYIFTNSAQVTNTFTPAEVKCEVQETYNYQVKSDVYIENTGNVDAYIRAMVFINWNDVNFNKIVPAPTTDPVFTPESGWVKGSDGYYYTQKVAPGGKTSDLIPRIEPPSGYSQYSLVVDIIAEAIQAEPSNVVVDKWGFNPASSNTTTGVG